MWEFIYNSAVFILAVAGVLFLPGFVLLSAVWPEKGKISGLEKFVFSFGLSIIVVDFISFLLSGLKQSVSPASLSLCLMLFILACSGVYFWKKKKGKNAIASKKDELFNFSRKQLGLVMLSLLLIFFLKTVYLSSSVLPTSTDMGHHMYWAKWMVENESLPVYDGMPDFIIGEHVIFGAVGMLTELSFFSAFPPLTLHLINLLGILTVFVLVLRIFSNKNIAILSLIFLGVFFAVSSPQSKFVSGGVVGNILGNFLMPLAFYFLVRAFEFLKEKKEPVTDSKKFLALAVFVLFGLFYTHHLTSFIFLFIFAFALGLFLILNLKELVKILPQILKVIFSWPVLATLLLGIAFFFFLFTPNYVKGSAVDTAVGVPEKITRVGLSLVNLKDTIGELRLALGIIGVVVLAFSFKRKNIGYLILVSWFVMIFLMSTKPGWLFIDLPSSRIGNYLSYPASVLGAFAFYFVFSQSAKKGMPRKILSFTFVAMFSGILVFGVGDSVNSFRKLNQFDDLAETFHASSYLAQNIKAGENLLKDHNYIKGDAWIKLFFMKGYRYPLSRSYFKRYEDPLNPREMCTLHMISSPGSEESQACFQETGTRFLMVNPKYDSAQFERLRSFDKIYDSSGIGVYYKNN